MNKSDRWTNADEAELQRLTKRKQELTAKNFAPLVALCQRELADEKTPGDLAEALAANADDFRDALEPFDSGYASKNAVLAAPAVAVPQPLTDERIVDIRDDHLPNQGERFDCIAFARAIEREHGIAANPSAPGAPT